MSTYFSLQHNELWRFRDLEIIVFTLFGFVAPLPGLLALGGGVSVGIAARNPRLINVVPRDKNEENWLVMVLKVKRAARVEVRSPVKTNQVGAVAKYVFMMITYLSINFEHLFLNAR